MEGNRQINWNSSTEWIKGLYRYRSSESLRDIKIPSWWRSDTIIRHIYMVFSDSLLILEGPCDITISDHVSRMRWYRRSRIFSRFCETTEWEKKWQFLMSSGSFSIRFVSIEKNIVQRVQIMNGEISSKACGIHTGKGSCRSATERHLLLRYDFLLKIERSDTLETWEKTGVRLQDQHLHGHLQVYLLINHRKRRIFLSFLQRYGHDYLQPSMIFLGYSVRCDSMSIWRHEWSPELWSRFSQCSRPDYRMKPWNDSEQWSWVV